jgi:hypothetical protein
VRRRERLGTRFRGFAHNLRRELKADKIFLFGFVVTH